MYAVALSIAPPPRCDYKASLKEETYLNSVMKQ